MSEQRAEYGGGVAAKRRRDLEQSILALLRIWERDNPAHEITGMTVRREPGIDRTQLAELQIDVRLR